MKYISDETRKKHSAVCAKCDIQKSYARTFDMHFDWIDCPFDCENDYEYIESEDEYDCFNS